MEDWLPELSWRIFLLEKKSSENELERDIECINMNVENRVDVLWSYKQTLKDNSHFSHFTGANICLSKLYKSLPDISCITKDRANQVEWLQMENKKAAQDFPGSICLPFWASLKVSFKTVICLWVHKRCDHLSRSSAGLGHKWNSPMKEVPVHLWSPQNPTLNRLKEHM